MIDLDWEKRLPKRTAQIQAVKTKDVDAIMARVKSAAQGGIKNAQCPVCGENKLQAGWETEGTSITIGIQCKGCSTKLGGNYTLYNLRVALVAKFVL